MEGDRGDMGDSHDSNSMIMIGYSQRESCEEARICRLFSVRGDG